MGPNGSLFYECRMCGGTIFVIDTTDEGGPLWVHLEAGCDDPVPVFRKKQGFWRWLWSLAWGE